MSNYLCLVILYKFNIFVCMYSLQCHLQTHLRFKTVDDIADRDPYEPYSKEWCLYKGLRCFFQNQ